MLELKTKLSADLKEALKAKDQTAIKAIRSLMAALDNAEAVAVKTPTVMPMSGGIAGATSGLGSSDVPRKELTNDDVQQIIQREINEIDKAIEMITTQDNTHPEIEILKTQKELLKKYCN